VGRLAVNAHINVALTMKTRTVCLLLILFLATACSNDETLALDIPVVVSSHDDTTIDIYTALDSATEEVNRRLPDAQLGFFSFTGQCLTFAEFEGEVFLWFTQTR
jgi:hypothetical protein